MSIFKKLSSGALSLLFSLNSVYAEKHFVVEICNSTASHPSKGSLISYEDDCKGHKIREIIQMGISYERANEFLHALEIYLPVELDGTIVELPLSCDTEKGERIYKVLTQLVEHPNFEELLLNEFKNLKKIINVPTFE